MGYVGSVSRHLTDVVDINQAAQGSLFLSPTPACPLPLQCSRLFFVKFPNYGVINQVQSGEGANYNSLQALIRTVAWHSLTSQFSYTLAHALDYETGLTPYLPQDSTNLKAEYGNSDFDTRHAFVGYVVYDVPGSSHGPKNLTHGWQVSSGLAFHTGQPYTPMASTNSSGNGESFDRADAVPGVSPYAGLCHCIVGRVVQWFNPAAFQDPPQGQYGNIRRGQYFNPGFSDVDLSVLKNTKITERFTLQLRVDMFNIFNHTNLGLVGAPQAGDGGGAIGSTIGSFYAVPGIGAGEPFNMQLAAKILF
ncbi:MAG: hypothetical protein ACREDR_44310 [Blastocatellia bacterium]